MSLTSTSTSDSDQTGVVGSWFDAQRSTPRPAILSRETDGSWRVTVGDEHITGAASDVQVTDRLGTVPRRLRWPGGAEFDTPDNDGIDRLLGRSPAVAAFVDRLERGWTTALASLLILVALSALFIEYGLPALSRQIAMLVPHRVEAGLGTHVLEWVDTMLLDDSSLEQDTRARLTTAFDGMTSSLDDGYAYRLLFRGGALGPNAMALPGGIVIVTDDLVKLARHDEEILAVLAHEIGHVRGRHTLRHLVQASGVSALAVVLLGDLSQITALATAAPALLEMRHARDLEREADGFAREWLRTHGMAESRFDDMLCRLAASTGGADSAMPSFMSSHPPVDERAACRPAEDQR